MFSNHCGKEVAILGIRSLDHYKIANNKKRNHWNYTHSSTITPIPLQLHKFFHTYTLDPSTLWHLHHPLIFYNAVCRNLLPSTYILIISYHHPTKNPIPANVSSVNSRSAPFMHHSPSHPKNNQELLSLLKCHAWINTIYIIRPLDMCDGDDDDSVMMVMVMMLVMVNVF